MADCVIFRTNALRYYVIMLPTKISCSIQSRGVSDKRQHKHWGLYGEGWGLGYRQIMKFRIPRISHCVSIYDYTTAIPL